jgi:serine/threonine-protein kinase
MAELSKKDMDALVKPGQVLAGKYLVDRVLGVGGMGVVVAATHTQLDQKVAIKFLLPSMMPNREVVERFQREARAAAKIRSEHVVRVSDVGALADGVPYIVMEFLEGRDLGDLLERRGVLPIPLAVDYVLEACEALAEAHAAGIVHRDLKPANLFLARTADDTEMIKVLDFGISKQISQDSALQSSPSLTKTTDVFGSPTYMSPEQLKASRDVDVRADIWALGVILFEILAGKPPFGGGTVAEIFGAILHQPAPRLRELRKDAPPELERLLLRCLEKDAAQRIQSVTDLADALVPFGSDAARESAARVARVLRPGPQSRTGGRPSQGGGRGSLPSIDPSEVSGVAAPANTGAGAGRGEKAGAEGPSAPPIGSATSTTWSNIEPAARGTSGSRKALVAVAVAAAAAGGAFLVLHLMRPSAGPGSGLASALPSTEAHPAITASSSATVVVPAPAETSSSTAAPPIVTPAPTD